MHIADSGCSGGTVLKDPPVNAKDVGLIPGSGKSPGRGNGNQLQYSCLENPMELPGIILKLDVNVLHLYNAA